MTPPGFATYRFDRVWISDRLFLLFDFVTIESVPFWKGYGKYYSIKSPLRIGFPSAIACLMMLGDNQRVMDYISKLGTR